MVTAEREWEVTGCLSFAVVAAIAYHGKVSRIHRGISFHRHAGDTACLTEVSAVMQ